MFTGLYDSLLPSRDHSVCLCHSLSSRPFGILRRIRRVVANVGATRLLAGVGADHRGLGDFDQVVEFQRLDAGGVPDLDLSLISVSQPRCSISRIFCTPSSSLSLKAEHAAVVLHRALHGKAGVVDAGAAAGLVFQTRQARQRLVGETGRQWLVFFGHRGHVLDHRIAGRLAEHQQIEQELVPRRLAPCTEAQAHRRRHRSRTVAPVSLIT